MKKILVLIISLLMLMSVVACQQQPQAPAQPEQGAQPAPAAEGDVPGVDRPVRIAHISKMLSHPWFIAEMNGMDYAASRMNVEVTHFDADLDDEAFEQALDIAIAQGVDAIVMCITNQGLGPSVAMRLRELGIALLTIDDDIVDEHGNPVPHVGVPTKDSGIMGGEYLARMAHERGFFDEGNVVMALFIDAPSVTVLRPRIDGFMEGLLNNTPLTEADVLIPETTHAMLEDALEVARATITAHPHVTHWIVGGVNDDCAIAPLIAIREIGRVQEGNAIFAALGGDAQGVAQWREGNDSYIAVVWQPFAQGVKSIEILYNYVVNGVPMPLLTLVPGAVATVDNWEEIVDLDLL